MSIFTSIKSNLAIVETKFEAYHVRYNKGVYINDEIIYGR